MKTQRNLLVAGSVLVLHVGAVWALQSGLVRRAVDSVVPETIMAVLIEPEPPQVVTPPKAVETPLPPPVAHKVAKHEPPPPAPLPAPQPVAKPTPAPAPEAPLAAPTQVALAPITQPVAEAAPPAPPAPVVVAKAAPAAPVPVELPSTDAEYLQNPKPAYPAISRKLREQGKVVVDVLIAADGSAQQAKVQASSGFDRLDAAALATVQRWRYVPGKKGGVATAMWFSVPINFVLE
ncbi:energy transducer TonB [Ramlibacter sp. AN1133]|uniref:energy transducer TonB n=1 Tax=Ramlibacter sp. AN1133 TaxID=3133429 RepID=UPI0030C2A175